MACTSQVILGQHGKSKHSSHHRLRLYGGESYANGPSSVTILSMHPDQRAFRNNRGATWPKRIPVALATSSFGKRFAINNRDGTVRQCTSLGGTKISLGLARELQGDYRKTVAQVLSTNSITVVKGHAFSQLRLRHFPCGRRIIQTSWRVAP
jgi:hypothetical protein